jgi:hypothetical protein
MRRATSLALLFSAVVFGQIGVPTLGYLPEGPRIRVMQGIPGAGAVGPILDVCRNLAQIAISPRQDYILASDSVTGEVLKIVPGGASPSITAIAGATANPDEIVMSPSGSSAVLWFSATNLAQIISGLPSSPSVRKVDVSVLNGAPTAVAVSDDGNWLAAASSNATGVTLYASNGSISTIPLDDDATGLAFFHNRAELAIATTSLILTADPTSTAPPSLAGNLNVISNAFDLAVSFDNQRIVAATGGILFTVDLTTASVSTLNCECAPDGLYGIGGSVFRVASAMLGGVKLFDAENNRILEVPNALSAALPERDPSVTRRNASDTSPPPLPAVTIGGLPASSGPDQQPAMTISIATAYSAAITGTATLTFSSSVGGDDQTIQFGTGGRTVSFTIPAGSTQASFSGKSSVVVMTGTVAGTITITLDLTVSGVDVTPTPPPTAAITLTTTPAFIQLVQFGSATPNGFTVVVTGFSSTRDMVSGSFQFAPSSNATLATSTVTVPLGPAFMTWYSNTASNAFGSQFQLTVPFTTQNGPSLDVVAVTVTLTNSKGASNPVVNQ